MKRMVLLLVIAVVVLGLGALAAPLSICSYVSPETNLHSLGLSMSYRYFDDLATPGADESGGRLSLGYSRLHEAPDMGYTLSGNAELLLTDFSPTSGLGDVAGTFRYYFSPDAPTFAFGGAEASIAMVQTGQQQPGLHISAGLGYGRFSDVTPMAKAFKIEEELLSQKAIPKRLDDSVLIDLAKAIGSKMYATTQEQVADVVNQIQTASGSTLSPRQVLMVEDLILATGDSRQCGWSVQAGVGYQLIDPYGQPQGFLVTASADAAFVPNPEGQALFHATLSGPVNIMAQNTLSVRASYSHAVSETSSLRASYTLLRTQPLEQPAGLSQSAGLSVGFVVGGADVGLQISLSKPADAAAWSIDVSVSAGITFDY